MQLSTAHITKNPIVLASAFMSAIGWLITFIGACIIGRAGGIWWIVIYELLLVGGILFSTWRQVFHHYQVMFIVFLGVSIALLTSTIDGLLSYKSNGNQTAGAGAIILVIMQYFWVILFGSTKESWVYRIVYSGVVNTNANNAVNMNSIHGSPKESKVALSSPEATNDEHHSTVNIHQNISPVMMPQPQTTISVVALHPC
ncbi:MAG: hypothetical protein EXX96DRAFT_566459 [Benjaminiella poitrasii]|nr:MAG: hypothetical protein EXX96DRAFT_566459 [Benjaminiella poitrasii]